eukprot:SAG11_NODE_2163_length_3728_cov_19.144944_3_plen_83_part_00
MTFTITPFRRGEAAPESDDFLKEVYFIGASARIQLWEREPEVEKEPEPELDLDSVRDENDSGEGHGDSSNHSRARSQNGLKS